MWDIYNRKGQPITVDEWGELLAQDKYRQLAETDVDDARVSTVWLGIDHSWSTEGPPLIFETMVFGGDHDGARWQYSTECEAYAGHARVVAALRSGE